MSMLSCPAGYSIVPFAEVVRETTAAVCLKVSDKDYWFPYSQVETMHFDKNANSGNAIIKTWIVKQKGLA